MVSACTCFLRAFSPKPACRLRQGFWRVHLCCGCVLEPWLALPAGFWTFTALARVLESACVLCVALDQQLIDTLSSFHTGFWALLPKTPNHTSDIHTHAGAAESTKDSSCLGRSGEGGGWVLLRGGKGVPAWGFVCSGLTPQEGPACRLCCPFSSTNSLLPRRQAAFVCICCGSVSRCDGAMLLRLLDINKADWQAAMLWLCSCAVHGRAHCSQSCVPAVLPLASPSCRP